MTNNEAVTGWVAQQLLKVTRTTVTTQLMSGAWPILGLSMHSPEIEVGSRCGPPTSELADYGIAITRLGNLDVNLDDDDNARLKKLAGDTAYSRLAGGFLQAAQAEAMQGAGEGMAQGGAAVTPDVPRRRLRHGRPDDAGSGAGPAVPAASWHRIRRRRPGLRRRSQPAAQPAAAAAAAAAAGRAQAAGRRPRRPSAPTATARSMRARSSAPNAARRCRSTAPTATPA